MRSAKSARAASECTKATERSVKLHENHPDIEKLKHSSLEFQSSNYLTNLPMLQASATADQFFGSSQQNQKPPAVPGSEAVVDPAYSPSGIQTCLQTRRLEASPESHITCICNIDFGSSKLRDTSKFETATTWGLRCCRKYIRP